MADGARSEGGRPDAGVATDAAAEHPPRARSWFAGKAAFWWVWPPLVALDLWSKSWVFTFLAGVAQESGHQHFPENHRPPWLVFDGRLRLELVSWGNTGTIWGIFPNSTVPLMVVRCAAIAALVWFLRGTARQAKVQQVVLGLVMAGAIGNLWDNFTRADRSVRDFLYFTGTWPVSWTFPAFNVADSCITVGAIWLFLLLWRNDRKPKPARVS